MSSLQNKQILKLVMPSLLCKFIQILNPIRGFRFRMQKFSTFPIEKINSAKQNLAEACNCRKSINLNLHFYIATVSFRVPRKQGSLIDKVFVQTSCYMHRLLHIHCLSQTDSTTLRLDRHQVRHPCHQFANLYYSTSQRFLCHLACKTPQFEIIDSTWACMTHARTSGQDISAKNHTITQKT